jgi:hypothetical protein
VRRLLTIVVLLLPLGLAAQSIAATPAGNLKSLRQWERTIDQGDQGVRQGIEQGSLGCKRLRGFSSETKAAFKQWMSQLGETSEIIERIEPGLQKLWEELEKSLEEIKEESQIRLAFFSWRATASGALRDAAGELAHLNCSVGGDLARYREARAKGKELFATAMERFEGALATEP